MVNLPACVDTADDYVLAEPAAWTPRSVDEAGYFFEPVAPASHRAGARRLDRHTNHDRR